MSRIELERSLFIYVAIDEFEKSIGFNHFEECNNTTAPNSNPELHLKYFNIIIVRLSHLLLTQLLTRWYMFSGTFYIQKLVQRPLFFSCK